MPFNQEDNAGLLAKLSGFKQFADHRKQRIKNVIHGKKGSVEYGIFDYRHTSGRGDSSSTSTITVILFDSPDIQLPQFRN